MRIAAFSLVCVLSIGVAVYALFAYSMLPLGAAVHPALRPGFEAHRLGILLHVFGASLALLLGPLQFSARLRRARPAAHRLLGKIYLGVGVLVGGMAGLYMAAFAYGGMISTGGFGLLALAWIYTGYRAYYAARSRRFDDHRAWMIRNYSLAFAAVMLRLYVGIGIAAGWQFEAFYSWLAWLCWVPNLLFAETIARHVSPPVLIART